MLSYGARHLQSPKSKVFVIYYNEYVYINYIRMFVETMVMILLSQFNRYIEFL
jgi:hypothetical protein